MKFKIPPQWRIINEFENEFSASGKIISQVTYCVMSDIRADVLMMAIFNINLNIWFENNTGHCLISDRIWLDEFAGLNDKDFLDNFELFQAKAGCIYSQNQAEIY